MHNYNYYKYVQLNLYVDDHSAELALTRPCRHTCTSIGRPHCIIYALEFVSNQVMSSISVCLDISLWLDIIYQGTNIIPLYGTIT